MDRVLDLKPEVTQGCGFESQLWQEVSTTEVRPLPPTEPPTAPWAPQCWFPTAPVDGFLDGLNAENTFHSSLYSV